jgi:hypothetical protein
MAKPGVASEVASGVELIPRVPALALPSEGARVGICAVQSRRALPRVLTLGAPVTGMRADGSRFPPASIGGSLARSALQCGLTLAIGAPIVFGPTTVAKLACVLEYGVGSCLSRVMFDWRPGSYNLPPCEFARVSALPWGTDWPLSQHTVLASLAVGELQDAMPPVCSGEGQIGAAAQKVFLVPAGAAYFDVRNSDDTGLLPVITVLQSSSNIVRNYVTGQFIPGWTPIEAPLPGQTITVATDVNAFVTIEWTLQL